jgi:hypothetical protein
VKEFLFQVAREYIYGKVSLVTLSSICKDYGADFVCHAVSELGQRLVFLGNELEYYARYRPDDTALEKTINEIKELCIFYCGEL